MLTFEQRRMQKESRKKNKKLQQIREDKENANLRQVFKSVL